jgi:L-fuconolactonase
MSKPAPNEAFMKIDSHQHFWVYGEEEYGWIGDGMEVLKRDFLPVDLEPQLLAAGLDGSIAVQARQTLEETRWLLKLADEFDIVKGVVGWVDLRSSDLQAQLEEFSSDPHFCGVRHILQSEPDDEYMLRKDFLRGISSLAGFDLVYEILIFQRHLPAAVKLVEQFPDQPFILDHLAKPLIKDGILTPWTADIQKLAQYPNVMCKLSGMVTEADWQHWQQDDFAPYIEAVFEAFGANRILYGSDWPVCLLAGSYQQVHSLVEDYVKKLSKKEQAAVWGGNAVRFYGLE